MYALNQGIPTVLRHAEIPILRTVYTSKFYDSSLISLVGLLAYAVYYILLLARNTQ